MEKTLQRVQGVEQLTNVFGVRHLSPASAYNLRAFLDALKPKCVLIEGPSDANSLIEYISQKAVKPPIAMLAYTIESPVKTVLYPFAEYSPEYQAILWAAQNKAQCRFIDLPSAAMASFDEKSNDATEYYKDSAGFYDRAAQLAGESNYDSFWERNFETCRDYNTFLAKTKELSASLRTCLEDSQWEKDKRGASYNLVREAHMKMMINRATTEFGNVAVICGAYHVEGLFDENPPMGEDELAALPQSAMRLTLMPYSYYRLSSQSGYGAGNKAPAYFKLLWDGLLKDDVKGIAPKYLSMLGGIRRDSGGYNSTANIIEGVRLAEGLAYMRGGEFPTLQELHEAAVCLLGGGELSAVSEAIARVDVGTEIGELPEGAAQTPVQEDMTRQLKELKIEKFKSVVAQDIVLDLREKRSASKTAFMDLNRSIFFNRLTFLNIRFARYASSSGDSAWKEHWILKWEPETEIELAESALKGDTIKGAAAFTLKQRFDEAKTVDEVAKLLTDTYRCDLTDEVSGGLAKLSELCVDGSVFTETATACREISDLLQYRDVRNIDVAPLLPIMSQLFFKSALIMFEGANCDDEASSKFIRAIDSMHVVSQEQFQYVDDALWLEKLRELAESDNRNAKISGVATALLLERNQISDEDLKNEVSKRLSYGTPGDLAALWFEGLCARNRFALLSRGVIFKLLDDYIQQIPPQEFKRAVVFLRRAFSSFAPQEKNSITEILTDLWGVSADTASEYMRDELNEEEQTALDSLNDFDFADLYSGLPKNELRSFRA